MCITEKFAEASNHFVHGPRIPEQYLYLFIYTGG